MTDETRTGSHNFFLDSVEYVHRIEKQIAVELGLSALRSGGHVIRNEKGWRDNEKEIDYVWIVTVTRSFVGWGGLFSVKFNENKFREYVNPNQLVQGIFACNKDGKNEFYFNISGDTTDKIAETFNFNLFDANKGITLDGIGYNVRIMARNIDTLVRLNNPNTEKWREWENMIFAMGGELAARSGNKGMIELFER